jgi:dUTP pyrophosphatase
VTAVRIAVRRLPNADGLPLPSYATPGSSGADVRAAVDGELVVGPGERRGVPTGIAVAVPRGFEIQVRPRSGLALAHGVTIVNSPGTIDSDYRGEVTVILANLGSEPFVVKRGDRVAQLVVAPVVTAEFVDGGELEPTSRGAGGFGSTGV